MPLTDRDGRLRDFCSAPFSDDWRSSIKLEEDVTPQDIVVKSGTVLRRITFDSTFYHLDEALPILSWIDHKFIQRTFYGYPHSEIQALNALLKINFHSIFDPIIKENDILQGLRERRQKNPITRAVSWKISLAGLNLMKQDDSLFFLLFLEGYNLQQRKIK